MNRSRRRFLALGAATAGALALGQKLGLFHLRLRGPGGGGGPPRAAARLGSWEDLYRQRWTWDLVAKGSHGWLNCRSACEWDVYVKGGIVVREEQSATYASSEPGTVPDFNPRGCQKGACYTEVMYGPSRLTVPLKRVGERGSGRWQRIGWEQALSEIATAIVDIAEKDGADAVFHDLGPHFDNGATTAARTRFFAQLGGTMADDWAEIGDLNLGAMLTLGFPHVGGTSDEWFLSDFLVVWMMNPAVTQMADAHFLFEARYRGATVTVIDPMYSATATHADRWMPLRPGTDAALALATARHVWESGRMDVAYVREQTDLPFLVRLDTGRFLRESDLVAGGRQGQLYRWDPKAGAPEPASGCADATAPRLFLEGREPPIEGRFEVRLASGATVHVATVGTLVREQLALWTFERAASVTGLHPDLVRDFAEGFARAERPMVLSSWGSNRYFHSDLMNRAKLLCLSLKGAIGKRGAGFHSTGWFGLDGFEFFADKRKTGLAGSLELLARGMGSQKAYDAVVAIATRKKTQSEVMYQLARSAGDIFCTTNSASANLAFQGVRELLDEEQSSLGYPRKLGEYDEIARTKGWMPLWPAKTTPRAWITGGNNVLRRTNMPQKMLEHLWPKLDLVVDMNPKLTFTGMHSDYVLPAAGYYEKAGIKYPVAYVPYLHYCSQAIAPIGESKDEWEIYSLLAQKIEEVARARGTKEVASCNGRTFDLKTLYARFSMDGRFGPADAEAVNQEILDGSPAAGGVSVRSLKQTGVDRYVSTGSTFMQSQLFNDDWDGDGVLTVALHQVKDRWPWPTLTGRQQYYVDHPWFIEAGETLPAHKESPKAGGDHPFQLISCHSRWSVHSIWRDTAMLLRLQRGEPLIYLNPEDAAALGLADHEFAELFNRHGAMRMRVKHSSMVRPGVAYYFHAWEPYQFPDHKSYKWITPGLMNPLHFAGGEGQTGWSFGQYEPGTHVQDTRVGIRKPAPSPKEA